MNSCCWKYISMISCSRFTTHPQHSQGRRRTKVEDKSVMGFPIPAFVIGQLVPMLNSVLEKGIFIKDTTRYSKTVQIDLDAGEFEYENELRNRYVLFMELRRERNNCGFKKWHLVKSFAAKNIVKKMVVMKKMQCSPSFHNVDHTAACACSWWSTEGGMIRAVGMWKFWIKNSKIEDFFDGSCLAQSTIESTMWDLIIIFHHSLCNLHCPDNSSCVSRFFRKECFI